MNTKNRPQPGNFSPPLDASPHVRYTPGLPILDARERILRLLGDHQVIVVAGDTGSGKSTQLPLMCIEAGLTKAGCVGVTQPRRIAATSLARRVAGELRRPVGEVVGYRIRFDERARKETPLIYMTDGILLNDIAVDPLLRRYSAIVIDEAHERSLNIDFLLGYLRLLLPKRPDLRVIVSSATINTALFAKAFDDAPVVEVSGRMFPVDVWYQPIDEESVEQGSTSYVDAAADAVTALVDLDEAGDILVFMPTERDIIETADLLKGRRLAGSLVLPLYGRMSPAMQNRIFDPATSRKIVIATNVAETSVTVPGIRFVIDTGLARVKRYAPARRMSSLPIEPISQAAAKQRMGRCGRVAEGVCIRLYSEEDLAARPAFTMPEIQRSNLASVILQMSAMGLGRPEQFPFIQPPARRAVGSGYAQLRELGAVDSEANLTADGKRMARFPLDPSIARMLLQAKREGAVREVKIIAAGLSIIDPRERPAERRTEADQMHARFIDPRSDFLTYVNLWNAYHDRWESSGSQRAMRRFCREHFLSYSRMREWADVHRQTSDILRHMKGFRERSVPASYEALHRSIVAGLIGNVATKEDDGSYRATRNRQVWLFPGSVLFSKRPPWVVCHDIVETSRVYARTLAAIDPAWLESLAPHLLRRHYAEPHFDPETGFVRAFETVTLFGLPIVKGRKADYGTIAPAEANELFIREGLVEERLRCRHRFFRKNRSVRQRVAELEAKLRTRGLSGGDEAVCAFYKPRLEGIRSIHELNRLIRSRGGDGFLLMAEKDLLVDEVPDEASRFPESVTVGGKNFALRYAFEPAAEHDGVTLSIPEEDAAHLDCDSVGWIIRPLWPEKIRHLLTQLPKNMRRRLMPLGSTARELARILQPGPGPFTAALTELIRTKHGIPVHNDLFREHDLPRHLRLRVEIRDARGEVIRSGRGAEAVAADASADGSGKKRPEEWKRKTASHERRGMQSWEIDSVPEMIEVGTAGAGVPLYGYPALCPGDNGVDVIVFTTREHADANHVRGVETLLEMVLAHELAWLARDLRLPQEIKVLCAPFGGHEQMAHRLEAMIRRSAISPGLAVPRTRASFEKLVEERERQLRYAGSRAAEILKQILTSAPHIRRTVDKHSLQGKSTAYSDIRKELLAQLDGYINILRCERVSWRVYEQLPRYLRALDIRARRAFEDPPRYRQRMNTYLSFCTESNELRDLAAACPRGVWLMEEMEMMLEEYLISLFAQQEMKTLFPVSEKRLRKKVTALREAMTGSR